ncbi:MAG: hypothetical protein ABSF65_01475 [Candidatus Bathyarchaeia archaeon]
MQNTFKNLLANHELLVYMGQKLSELKSNYYAYLDRKARHIACRLSEGKAVGKLLLLSIEELYSSAHTQRSFDQDNFRVRYHNPISSELEFVIARVMLHYSRFQNLHWSIYLRCQQGKTAPDIRIAYGGKTLAILEIKAKAGWIQAFFSSERANKDLAKLKEGKSNFDPEALIQRVSMQFKKYYETYNISPEQVFVLLPSLALVHRKSSSRILDDYVNDFANNSGLPKNNLILLSNNLLLDLSPIRKGKKYEPTGRFGQFIQSLVEWTKNDLNSLRGNLSIEGA